MVGFLSGYVSRTEDGQLKWHELVWDLQTILYTSGLVGGVLVAFFLTRYYEDPQTRWGARLLVCALPLALPSFPAFGLIEFSFEGTD